jgi:epoxyqueuosine reductase
MRPPQSVSKDSSLASAGKRIREHAIGLGFDTVGFARMEAGGPQATRLRAFLDAGRHGDMEWMELTADRRGDPLVLWPEARSAVMVAMSYAPPRDPMDALGQRDLGIISVYAQGKDYHEILKPKLKHLAREVVAITSGDVKVFVDTAPLMEKPLAALAGLGWQGKHTNLVSRVHGSWLFLGALLTTAELDPDEPEADHCGSCRRCLDICPTAAFPAPYQLDARRCIAYLTIEHKGQIGQEFRTAIGNRIFGCDDCLAVCPWNKFAAEASEIRFAARSEAANPPIAELLTLTDDQFRARFAGTPVKRTGRDRFVRNVLIAAGNSDDQTLLGKVRPLLDDASPLVRGMAVWALSRLASEEMFQHERSGRYEAERDPGVRAEWMTETT